MESHTTNPIIPLKYKISPDKLIKPYLKFDNHSQAFLFVVVLHTESDRTEVVIVSVINEAGVLGF